MNKLFKILMVVAVCAALLVMVGCGKQDNVTGGEGTNQAAGNNDATEGTKGEDKQNVTENPEGDPFDSTDPEGGNSAESKATEPPVGIEDPTESTEEDDFEIDFDDLT